VVILRGSPHGSSPGAPVAESIDAICQDDSCIVLTRARHADHALAAHPLMVAAARGGREWYTLGHRRLAVDDDNFLIVNEGRPQASLIRSDTEVESFRIFFRKGLADEVLAALVLPVDRLLEHDTPRAGARLQFSEGLRSHDRLVWPVLAYIRHQTLTGCDDAAWFDEQLSYLLERLLLGHRQIMRRMQAMTCTRPGTRREIHRRVVLAIDYIESCYEHAIELKTLARVACLSKFHFLRAFRSLHGMTPQDYLQRKRAFVARRLLATTTLPTSEVALRVGYSSPTSLRKQMRQWLGAAPAQIRCGANEPNSLVGPLRHILNANLAME
jgi:AraC family transcriptional regulator